jgi:hypothetical protein
MKKTLPIAIALLIIAGGTFYWFQWRPSEARKDCFESSLEMHSGGFVNKEIQAYVYSNCMKLKGVRY